MPTIQVLTGAGMTFNENKLTTDWATTDGTDITPTIDESGIHIPNLVGSSSSSSSSSTTTVDNVTINSTLDLQLQVNREVVQFIHTMCAFQVVDRPSIKGFTVNTNAPKTIEHIVDEMNAVMEADQYLNVSKYSNLKVKNFFQLTYGSHPTTESEWPVALDNNIRQFGDTCLAFFVIEECEYNTGRSKYVSKLSLKCLWSKLSNFSKGMTYTATRTVT